MLCIVFYLNLRLKYVVKYLFLIFLNTRGYLLILKNYTGTRITDTRQIWIRARGSYYSYPTHSRSVPLTSLVRWYPLSFGCVSLVSAFKNV